MRPVLSSRACPVASFVVRCQLVIDDSSRSIVGRPRHQGVMVGMGQKDSYVGYVPLLAIFAHSSPFAYALGCRRSVWGPTKPNVEQTDQVRPPTVMKPSRSVVSSPSSTRSTTVLLQTGMTWKRFGTTPSTTSSVSHQRSTPCFSPRLPSTPKWVDTFSTRVYFCVSAY